MKIMIVPSWYPSDDNPLLGIFFKEQSLSLQKHGYDVTVLYPEVRTVRMLKNHTMRKKGITIAKEDGLQTYRNVVYNFIPGRVPFTTAYYFYKSLRNLYDEAVKIAGKPDLIHAHSCLWGGWAAAKLAKEEHIPFFITEHSSNFVRGLLKPYEKKEIAKTLNMARNIISVGPSLTRELEKYTDKPIIDIPNIVNIEDFQLIQRSFDPSRKFRFLSVAFLTHNKGMDVLIHSFAKAFKEKDAELYIGGDGIEKDNLVLLAEELGVAGQVVFLGSLSREQVKAEMQRCDAFVLASRFETFGVVLIEALATGKPIIATKCGGPEVIVNPKNGLLVPVENSSELSKAMVYMKGNGHLYNPKELRKDCIKRFSEAVIIKKISALYLSHEQEV